MVDFKRYQIKKDKIEKIIFLDIDGVLNPSYFENSLFKMWKNSEGKIKSKDEYGQLFFDQNVMALRLLIGQTGAKIVLSSTWRMAGIEAIQKMWIHRALPGEVIGVTPILRTPNDNIRGHEIDQYMEERDFWGRYVIIDDNDDMLKIQKHYFVKTDSNFGLTMEDARAAIQILNKE